MSRGLPVELTSFVGRRKELAEGRRMLRAARLVTVAGPGGVGKTRLAVRLAHQVQRLFPDGVVWVGLATQQDPAAVASEVATALELDPQGQPVQDALSAYLRSRELLLVLDNCEHLAEACAGLVTRLVDDAPRIRVLATGRRPLGVSAEHLISLQPLALPTAEEAASGAVGHVEAVALLADRARSVDRAFHVGADNAEVISRLVRRVDGIPLAIELAAARLRALSVAELVERLDDRFGVLTMGSRVAPPRHQTLRALIEWSYDLCSPAEQALWARMSVFDGGADLAAIEAVCADPDLPVPEVLAGLVDKSVLSTTGADGRVRYQMLETMREYGAERLAERGETASMRDRHRDHYLAFARYCRTAWVGPDQLAWLARVNLDLGNLRAAFEHSLADPGDRTPALELATSLVWFWTPASQTEEGARWFARAVADPDEQSPMLLQTLVAATILASDRSDMDTALPLASRAGTLTPGDDPADLAAHHVAAATCALLTGDRATAETSYGRALVDYETAGDLLGQLESLAMLAILAERLGRPDEALSIADRAMEICERYGEVFMRSHLSYFRGEVFGLLGRPDESLAALRSSLQSWRLMRPVTLSSVLHQIARAYASSGQAALGTALLAAYDRIRADHGVRSGPFANSGLQAVMTAGLVEALGEERFRAAYDQGYALSSTEAVQVALGREPDPPAGTSAEARLTLGLTAVLSERERQVAGLLVRGLSNKQIAAELVVSPRTAEGHVAKVLDKLGVHSRDEVAARLAPGAAPPQE